MEECLVSLGVEFDADDVWVFVVQNGEEGCGEVEDVPGADEGDHKWLTAPYVVGDSGVGLI